MKTCFAVCLCLMLAGPAMAAEFSLPLAVEEPAGVARKSEPVSGGVPMPAGMFKKDQAFALFEGEKEVPVQVLPMVVDEQGCLRWVLVDFQTDLAAKEKKTFTLKNVRPTVKKTVFLVRVGDTPENVDIDTGPVSLLVSKTKAFGLFGAVGEGEDMVPQLTDPTMGGPGRKRFVSGGAVTYTDGFDGKTYVADKPTSVEVEYAGPMRATVCVKGRFVGDDANKFQYIARVTAWAGRSDVLVKYSLANSNPDHYCYRKVKDSTIELKLAGKPEAVVVGASKPLEATGEAWMQQSMRVFPTAIHSHDSMGEAPWYNRTTGATGPGGCKAMSGEKELWTSSGKGDVSQGWIAAKTGAGHVWVTDMYFVEDPPRKLAVEKGSLLLTGVTEPLEGTQSPFSDRARWLFDCSHLSSQYVIDFGAPEDAGELTAKARAARGRLWVVAPPAYYSETQALPVGRFGTQDDEMKCYDAWGWAYDAKAAPKSAGNQTARIGRWVCGDDNHFTSEQDTVEALLVMFARTGSRTLFDQTESWVNYFMDLQTWRTDGWRYRDGGVWWLKSDGRGPLGNRPSRAKDPVTGQQNGLYGAMSAKAPFGRASGGDLFFLANAKACYCHNWGEGLVEWFMLTGDRDALEAAMDTVEQNYDAQKRSFGKTPGKPAAFSRDFTRACYLANATRLIAPTDPFVIEVSDYLAAVYLKRPDPEPRGLCNSGSKVTMADIEARVGPAGVAKMKELGVTLDAQAGQLVDPKSGAKWLPVVDPHTWMFPPLSNAMEIYYRITGNEDVADWLVAFGQGAAHVLFQQKHGNLAYGVFLADFPTKGLAWDRASWNLSDGKRALKDEKISGYLAQFWPDTCARAYSLCGEPFLKQRARDFWAYGTHVGADPADPKAVNRVTKWVNCYSTHDESVCYTGRLFYEWAHPRKDESAPVAVKDLEVTVKGDEATVNFTAPTDAGGKVARYQVKCSDKPIVSYEDFLKAFEANGDAKVTNWWMAKNVAGEPEPKAAGTKESFVVTGVPAGARYFAVCACDDSSNRSVMSNVAEAAK